MSSPRFLDTGQRAKPGAAVDLASSWGALQARIGRLRLTRSGPQPLPELRLDDTEIIGRRKADALLQSVRLGAVRR